MMTLFKVLVVIGILVIVFNIGRCYGLDEAREIMHEEIDRVSREEGADAKKIHNS